MMVSRKTIVGVTTALLVGLCSVVEAQPKKLGVGLFVPEIPFSNPAQRYSLVRGLAQHLSSQLGIPVEGRAYKSAGDFERDVRGKKIQFAVIGAFYMATKRARVLATAQVKRGRVWSIMAKTKKLADLKGKVLQLPSMGPITVKFVENGLLDSSVAVKKHFKIGRSPDLNSAIQAVKFGRAQAVLAPVDTPGLVKVVGGLAVPAPAFAVVGKGLPKDLVAKTARAVMSYGASVATLQGWRGPSGYGAIAAAARKKVKRMVLAGFRVVRLQNKDLIEIKKLRSELPRLEDLYWVP